MLFRGLGRVLHNVRRAAIVSGAVPRTDGQLLDAFVYEGDEACFDALVHRYGPMVYAVCRRVLRHVEDAEDAFQATFLVLVRKAPAIRRREAVGNWLYGVAYRTALQAKSRAARRRSKEATVEAPAPEQSTLETVADLELQALLDRELSRLPEKYRAAVVLCELLGKTKKQAAEELRCPEGTVSSRLARGRELLQKRLAQHDAGLPSMGASLLEQTKSQMVPPLLYDKTLKAAVLVAAGKISGAGGVAPNVAALLHGVLNAMLISKLKIVVGVAMVLSALGTVASAVVVGPSGVEKVAAVQASRSAGPEPVFASQPNQPQANVGDGSQLKKERFLYGGKDFNAWSETLQTDLKPEVRIEAIKALGAFGVNGYAEEAASVILGVVTKYDTVTADGDDLRVIEAGSQTLARIGSKAVPALANGLENKNTNVRRVIARMLPTVSRSLGAQSFPLFVRGIKDEDPDVRRSAFQAEPVLASRSIEKTVSELTALEKQELLAALVAALKEKDVIVLQWAVTAIAWLGPEAKPAVPALIKLLEEISPAFRQPKTPEPGEKTAFEDEAIEQFDGLQFGQGFGPQGFGPQNPQGKKQSKGGKGGNTGGPFASFPGIGEGGVPARDLESLILKTLGRIGAEEAVEPLLTILKYDRENQRLLAIEALGQIGPTAREAVPALMKEVKDYNGSNLDMTVAAVNALGKIGSKANEAVPALIQALDQASEFGGGHYYLIGKSVIIALGNIGPSARDAVPKLVEIRDGNRSAVRGSSRDQWIELQTEAAAALARIQK
jgi:RNA polymerase sigma factor (sigma-70 family)